MRPGLASTCLTDKQVDVLLSRDLDSGIIDREAAAVQEWLKSDKDFHFMRDHPSKTLQTTDYHMVPSPLAKSQQAPNRVANTLCKLVDIQS